MHSRILKTENIVWRSMLFLQTESFKHISQEDLERLKKSLLNSSFTAPFYVWQDPSDEVIYCLDGYHRSLALKELIEEGEKIPEELPATFVECSSKQEAARLVLQYSSQYANVTASGFASFVEQYDIEPLPMADMYSIPYLDIQEIYTPPDDSNTGSGKNNDSSTGTGGGAGSGPKASDNDYSTFELVMFHANKVRLMGILNRIRTDQELDKLEDALIYILDEFEKITDEI